MKWFKDRTKNSKNSEYAKQINQIKENQLMSLLELVDISISGLQLIGVPSSNEDVLNQQYYLKLFDDTIIELQRYVSTYRIKSIEDDGEIDLSEDGMKLMNGITKMSLGLNNITDSDIKKEA